MRAAALLRISNKQYNIETTKRPFEYLSRLSSHSQSHVVYRLAWALGAALASRHGTNWTGCTAYLGLLESAFCPLTSLACPGSALDFSQLFNTTVQY